MNEEKKILLNKIDNLLKKRKSELLNKLPSIHEVDDGIIIRFFTDWDGCADNNDIKFKKIINLDRPNEKMFFFYIPKGAVFNFKKRDYISTVTCLNGMIELDFGSYCRIIPNNTKICLESDEFQGIALENTYLTTTNFK